jgi:hypothetical protein
MARRATALKAVDAPAVETVVVTPINLVQLQVKIRGTAPLVMNAFSEKARMQMMTTMATPKSEKKPKSERPPRDYDAEFEQAHHRGPDGWVGFPCSGYRAAIISACRLAGVVMTRARQAVFIRADGLDVKSGQPLVRIIAGEGERTCMHVRNENGVADIRVRPMWREWEAVLTIEYDADWISAESVLNLINRAGYAVGCGEGRPGSPNSVGMGWGTFEIIGTLQPKRKPKADDKVRPLVNMLHDDGQE